MVTDFMMLPSSWGWASIDTALKETTTKERLRFQKRRKPRLPYILICLPKVTSVSQAYRSVAAIVVSYLLYTA